MPGGAGRPGERGRKRIFIIHGLGQLDGIGKEGGGDLDTIASNAFLAAWARADVRVSQGREAVYGEDFEFDFVNYAQGLRHLLRHRGCDCLLYIPPSPRDS